MKKSINIILGIAFIAILQFAIRNSHKPDDYSDYGGEFISPPNPIAEQMNRQKEIKDSLFKKFTDSVMTSKSGLSEKINSRLNASTDESEIRIPIEIQEILKKEPTAETAVEMETELSAMINIIEFQIQSFEKNGIIAKKMKKLLKQLNTKKKAVSEFVISN